MNLQEPKKKMTYRDKKILKSKFISNNIVDKNVLIFI